MAIALLQAKTLALAAVQVAPVKRVALADALGRFLAEGVTARRAGPAEDLSAVDGYAVAALDTRGAKRDRPVRLRLTGGDADLKPGQARKLAAGRPVPFGADAVVKSDSALAETERVTLLAEVAAGAGVRRRGEQWREGELLVPAGHRVDAAVLSVLGALGVTDVPVRPLTRVALLAADAAGLAVLASLTAELCTEVVAKEILGADTAGALERCLPRAEVLVACPADGAAFAQGVKRLGGTLGFDAVALKPGRQASVAVFKNKPIAVAPLPQLAALAAFDVLARPMLLKRQGVVEVRRRVTVRLDASLKKRPGRRLLVPARLEQTGDTLFATFRAPAGGALAGALGADGWLVIPEETGDLERGDAVELELLHGSAFTALQTNPHDEATR